MEIYILGLKRLNLEITLLLPALSEALGTTVGSKKVESPSLRINHSYLYPKS
jgi:hypothetical protein